MQGIRITQWLNWFNVKLLHFTIAQPNDTGFKLRVDGELRGSEEAQIKKTRKLFSRFNLFRRMSATEGLLRQNPHIINSNLHY